MSRTGHQFIEDRNDPYGHPQWTLNQTWQSEPNFGDSSEPLFSIYSRAAEEEDNKMVKSWQKDADGILIFTGLFSAAVAALLAITVPDLRPNSQNTSAIHLGNIYEVLTNPNVTRTTTPFSAATSPPFSPPKYAIWVNSLWFLSLVISLTCALLATSLQQWARRYIRFTQPALCRPEKRARMHAFFAEGMDKMHIPWAVEILPTLLHLSLFLFFGGLVIFLFNVSHAVFSSVVGWIGLCTILYGWITVMPIIRHDSPYCAPLSRSAWSLYAGMRLLLVKVLAYNSIMSGGRDSSQRIRILKARYRGWMSGGVEGAAEEMMLERSSKMDIRIFDWTIGALGDDDSLERFFEAIPGFFNSDLVKDLEKDFPETLLEAFWAALDRFMGRTSSSKSVKGAAKARRVKICRDIMSVIPCPGQYNSLRDHFDHAPISIERLQVMARWCTHSSGDISSAARAKVAKILPKIRERDTRWTALASEVYGISESDLKGKVDLGVDNMLLATLIDICGRAIGSSYFRDWDVLAAFTQFDIRYTRSGLQHEFCSLWNRIVQEAGNKGPFSTPIDILHGIRYLYIALHQDTTAAPTAFSAYTDDFDHVLFRPSSYPSCNIASHRPEPSGHIPVTNSHTVSFPTQPSDSPYAAPHQPTPGSNTTQRPAEEISTIQGPPLPPDLTTAAEIGESSQPPTAPKPTLPAYISPLPTDAPPPGAVVAVLQEIPSTATLSHPLEGNDCEDIVTPCTEPDNSETSSTEPTPTPTSAPVQIAVSPPVLDNSLISLDAGPASTSNSLLPAFSIPDSRTQSRVVPLQSPNLIALLGGTTPSHPINGDTLPRLRSRGLVNSENNCFANAVLQMLVHCSPFWNLFMDLGRLMGQRELVEGLETAGGATPLVDAKIKFLDEFAYKEELSVTQQLQQEAARGKATENEEREEVDSFNPRYMFDVMKEKRQLKNLLNGKHQDAEEFLGLYLEALDEELVALHAYISTHEPASVVEELEEGAQSGEGQTEMGKRDYTANLVETPISRIFGGRSRSTVSAPNQPDTVTFEAWRSLQLIIQPDSVRTIQDALVHVSQPQPVHVGQSGSTEASQRVLLEALPPVLVLHLKRFLYDAAADISLKISKLVRFTPQLEIPLEIMAPVAGKSAEPAHYKLYGVLYHHGKSAGSGHYTVDVLHPNGDGGGGESWLHIDDEIVSAVRHEDVFGGHEDEWLDGRCAYMLFYRRTASTGT